MYINSFLFLLIVTGVACSNNEEGMPNQSDDGY